MSKNLSAVVDIARPPHEVWQVLIDFAGYRRWNPFIIDAPRRSDRARQGLLLGVG
jgi:uncharacterized protein YndB with AHSA1/START domain